MYGSEYGFGWEDFAELEALEVEREGILFGCDGWAEEEVVDVVDFDAEELEEAVVEGR